MFVPLHDGHQVKQDCERTERKAQCDIAFAAGAVCIVIPHDQNAMEDKDKAGMPISFSAIRDAKSAAR